MEKNRKKQIVVLSIALVCIFILVFSLFHKSATKDSANPPLTNVLTDSISQIVSACPMKLVWRLLLITEIRLRSIIRVFIL